VLHIYIYIYIYDISRLRVKLNLWYENVGSLLKISGHKSKEEKTGLKDVARLLNILLYTYYFYYVNLG